MFDLGVVAVERCGHGHQLTFKTFTAWVSREGKVIAFEVHDETENQEAERALTLPQVRSIHARAREARRFFAASVRKPPIRVDRQANRAVRAPKRARK